ncbi:MAG: hypothetical protein M0Z44_03810 [Gammaproteobacteria bacterium]|nr:hypothetical protein [Gammaproteobacteria bacterium]
MKPIPDFTDTELWVARTTVRERYGQPVPVELADSELRLDPESTTLTVCPTLFWTERGTHFVIFKIDENRYKCQFFYSVKEQYGTGRDVYDDLGECVTHVLQLQADHERQRGLSADAPPEE